MYVGEGRSSHVVLNVVNSDLLSKQILFNPTKLAEYWGHRCISVFYSVQEAIARHNNKFLNNLSFASFGIIA